VAVVDGLLAPAPAAPQGAVVSQPAPAALPTQLSSLTLPAVLLAVKAPAALGSGAAKTGSKSVTGNAPKVVRRRRIVKRRARRGR
jgi:hypothetical protein